MKPDWSSASVPDWASYAAQELSGSWLFHEFKPTFLEITGEWRSSGRWSVVPKVTVRPQETLEQRPAGPYPLVITPEEARNIEVACWQGALLEAGYVQSK